MEPSPSRPVYPYVDQSSPPKSIIPDSKDTGNQQYSSRHNSDLNINIYLQKVFENEHFEYSQFLRGERTRFSLRHYHASPLRSHSCIAIKIFDSCCSLQVRENQNINYLTSTAARPMTFTKNYDSVMLLLIFISRSGNEI